MSEQQPQTRFTRGDRPLVAVADLHGHLDLFQRLLAQLDAEYGDRYLLVTLGDYIDNGSQIKELLDFLIDLRARRPERFFPILGNHDLACLRALGWPSGQPDMAWSRNWSARYWNPGGETPAHYGASSATDFARKFPTAHFEFLASLPWFRECEDFLFVHAGLTGDPLAAQRELLSQRQLLLGTKLDPQIREKRLSVATDHPFPGTVVSGHTQESRMRRLLGEAGRSTEFLRDCGCFAAPNRITLNSNVDSAQELHYVVLPERSFGVLR